MPGRNAFTGTHTDSSTSAMADAIRCACESLNSALGYLVTMRISEVRHCFELLGVAHVEVLAGVIVFILMQFTKFTAVLMLAILLAYGIFYLVSQVLLLLLSPPNETIRSGTPSSQKSVISVAGEWRCSETCAPPPTCLHLLQTLRRRLVTKTRTKLHLTK